MDDPTRRFGRLGLAISLLVWGASVPALAFSMQANEAAFLVLRQRSSSLKYESRAGELHGHALLWGMAFVALQLSAPLLLAFTLRAEYRLRSAVCFALSAGIAMALDGLGLLGLLAWLRWTLGAG